MERVEAFLNLVGYKIIHTERDLDEKNHQSIFVHCEPEVPRARCPLCGSQIAHVKDHLTRTVQDFDSGGQHVYLIVHIVCLAVPMTFNELLLRFKKWLI